MTFILNAPQMVLIAILIIIQLVATIKHGQQKGDYNAYFEMGNSVALIAILAWGGFFS